MRRSSFVPLALLLAASGVWAQEERPEVGGYTFLPEARWLELTEQDVGRRYYLEGRWKECWGGGISLYTRDDLRTFLFVPTGDLRDYLVTDRDSVEQPITKRTSVVRVFGTALKGRKSVLLRVDRVDKLPDEDEQFRQRLEELGDDPDAIERLGRDCARQAERYDDAKLREVVTSITRRELDARRRLLQPDDWPGRMTLAERYLAQELRHLEGALEGAINLYAEVFEAQDAATEQKQAAYRKLYELRAVRVRTESTDAAAFEWLPYETFKRREGFVHRADASGEGRWIRREWAELEDERQAEVARRTDSIELVRQNHRQCGVDAEKKVISRGQYFYEVRLAAGLPQAVNHMIAPFEHADVVWTQWILGDGRRVYFVQGEVISVKPADAPWPGD